jgi:FtsH-binding integral membrane protein
MPVWEYIAPMTMGLAAFALVAFIVYQILTHRQRMKMIEKGISRLEISQVRAQADTSIKYGLIFIALGLGIWLAQIFEAYNILIGGEMALAFVPIFVGVALIISAIIERRREKQASKQIDQMKMESAA